MKKIESLTLSKFKKHELSKENHNAVLGGWQGATYGRNGSSMDDYDDSSKYFNSQLQQYMWPSSDVTARKSPQQN